MVKTEKLVRQVLKNCLVLRGEGFKFDEDGDYDVENKTIVDVRAGTSTAEAINVGQLTTLLATKVARSSLADPSPNIGPGKIPTYDNKNALVSSGLIINDSRNNTVEIWPKDQDFFNIPNRNTSMGEPGGESRKSSLAASKTRSTAL